MFDARTRMFVIALGVLLVLLGCVVYDINSKPQKFTTIQEYRDCTLVYDNDTHVEYFRTARGMSPVYDSDGNIIIYEGI